MNSNHIFIPGLPFTRTICKAFGRRLCLQQKISPCFQRFSLFCSSLLRLQDAMLMSQCSLCTFLQAFLFCIKICLHECAKGIGELMLTTPASFSGSGRLRRKQIHGLSLRSLSCFPRGFRWPVPSCRRIPSSLPSAGRSSPRCTRFPF